LGLNDYCDRIDVVHEFVRVSEIEDEGAQSYYQFAEADEAGD
jgi:hypothetical protein